MSKWLSRKLFVAVGGVLTAILVNVGLPEPIAARITEVILWVAATYLGAQGIVDLMHERSKT